jgi:hypothetical protein
MHVPPSLRKARLPGQEKVANATGALKKRVQYFRQGHGVTDVQLLEQAKKEFDERRRHRLEEEERRASQNIANKIVGEAPSNKRNGFIVLGMHRSGTSMLSGLLATGFGYNVGNDADLVVPNFDNEKGFFERV